MSRWRTWAWIAIAGATLAALGVGVGRGAAPRSAPERVGELARQVACPRCNGESVAESNAPVSQAIRAEIERLVTAGQRSDEEILSTIEAQYPGSALIPRGAGVEAWIWIIPVAVAVVAAAGLTAAVRRWRGQPGWAWPVWVIVGVFAVGAGWVVARWNSRPTASSAPPASVTTVVPGGSVESTVAASPRVAELLATARAQMATNRSAAADAFLEILKLDPGNVEARTYAAWLVVLQGREAASQQLVNLGLDGLRRVTAEHPQWADAHCFVAIGSARMLTPADLGTARAEAQRCVDLGGEQMRALVEPLLASLSTAPPATG